ncbi:MAG: DUF4040 domain-containing protein [Xenococcus sp. (in: cyanobacteria)]
MIDKYIYVIVALLPKTSAILLFETNPYNALILRGILGGVAALVYAVLGAADVSLTEALVGTMLAVTLYVIAVRSSLVMRLGIIAEKSNVDLDLELVNTTANQEIPEKDNSTATDKVTYNNLKKHQDNYQEELLANLRKVIKNYHLRLELVEYANSQVLEEALITKEVHAICSKLTESDNQPSYLTKIRVHRLFEILQTELTSSETSIKYINLSDSEDKH